MDFLRMLNTPAVCEDGDEDSPSERLVFPDPLAERFLKTRTILLSGVVDKETAAKVVSRLLLLESQSEDPVRILIDSPGGDVDAGYAIFDMARFVKTPVWMIGMGLVASAGALVLLAAPRERRIGLPNSHYLIHQPLSGLRGVATDIEIHAREIERTRDRINLLIAQETGQDLERVRRDTDRDYWMTAEEAVAYGLISRTVTRRDEL
ncbi:MAG TPA: ATP-dependent Clp protease proteolytic subunit [Magnetospirillaceae bacterium]|nr:ATP-dependent Clp protease proteolytic subunit [Magnetospirillaceae bacterium]